MSPLRGEAQHRPTYRILERLTSGLGDEVFLTHHEIFDGKFVQKTVDMHGLEDALAANEPAFMHRLDHPRVVPVREAQWDPKYERAITFVMPHFPGGSIDDKLLEDYRFSINQAVGITIDALDGLAYLHREWNALHRDNKPGNVLLDGDCHRGYLSDFGSAATMDAMGSAAAVLGTNVYRPPETRLTGQMGKPAEVYGVGMTLYEMVSGRIPWETLQMADVEARLQRGQRAVPDRMLAFEPHVPERLRRCVRKAISRRPADRFECAEDFITALRSVRSIDWRHTSGSGSEGIWVGAWPPQVRPERRIEYRVTTRVIGAGPHKGRLLVESDYRRPSGGWRQAVVDTRIEPADSRALSRVFQQVEASAAHRSPAR